MKLRNVDRSIIKLEFNENTKMAAEASRFKMPTTNDRAINRRVKGTRDYLMLNFELGLDWSS